MTFRVLHTGCHEVLSADHRLTFRDLPAEGLGAQAHDAASHSTTLAGASGAPRSPQREDLFAASGGIPNCSGAAWEPAASCFAALPGSNAAANRSTHVNPGRVFLAGRRRTILVLPAGSVSIVCCSASLGHANRGCGTLLQKLGRGFSAPSGRRLRARLPKLLVRGTLDLPTWISTTRRPNIEAEKLLSLEFSLRRQPLCHAFQCCWMLRLMQYRKCRSKGDRERESVSEIPL